MPQMLQLYLAHDRCGWLDPSGVGNWHEDEDFDGRLAQFLEAAAQAWPRRALRGRPVKVWTSGGLIRPFLLGPVAGLNGSTEICSFAQSQVSDATGWIQPCEVRLEGDVTKGVALATAMPAAEHERVEAAVKRAKLRLLSLRPWWAAVLDQALAVRPELELLAVEDTESLVLLATQGGNWSMAETFAPRPSADEAIRVVQRMAAGASVQPERSAWWRWDAEMPNVGNALWPAARPSPFEGRS